MDFTVSNRMSSLKGSAIREMFKKMADPTMISLAGGNPAAELFPNEELSVIAADILKENPVGALQYGISEGNIPLREKILEMMKKRENIDVTLDEIKAVVMKNFDKSVEFIEVPEAEQYRTSLKMKGDN